MRTVPEQSFPTHNLVSSVLIVQLHGNARDSECLRRNLE